VFLRCTQERLDLKKSAEDEVKEQMENIESTVKKLKSERAKLEQKANCTQQEMQKV